MNKDRKHKLHNLYPILPKDPAKYFCMCIEITQKGDYRPLIKTIQHDEFYHAVEQELRALLGNHCVIRISNHCFIVLKPFPNATPMGIAERINHQRWMTNTLSQVLQQLVADYESTNLFLTKVTIGTASSGIHYHVNTFDELIELAHYTTVTAKERRLSYIIADDHIRAGMRDLVDFSAALRNDSVLTEFSPFFQPIIDLDSNMIIGCEAFARWQKESYRVIEAIKFKDLAYEMNLMEKIDRTIINKAFNSISRFKKLHLLPESFFIVLNISSMTILSFSVTELIDLAEKYGIRPEQLELDIKDKHLSNHLLTEKIKQFRAAGIRVALDAFDEEAFDVRAFLLGEYDTLKIKFTSPAGMGGKNNKQLEFFKTLSDIAGDLNIKPMAKDIEEKYQIIHAKQLGIKHVQGNYFIQPLNFDKFREFLRKYRAGLYMTMIDEAYDRIS